MLAKVFSAAVWGVDAYAVKWKSTPAGKAVTVVVGLPDTAVKESRHRVITAVNNSAFRFPYGRVTFNLAPADVKKEGPSFDLPMALGIVAASDQLHAAQSQRLLGRRRTRADRRSPARQRRAGHRALRPQTPEEGPHPSRRQRARGGRRRGPRCLSGQAPARGGRISCGHRGHPARCASIRTKSSASSTPSRTTSPT